MPLPTQIWQAPTNAARDRNLKCVATFAHVADSPTEREILPAVTSHDLHNNVVSCDNCENVPRPTERLFASTRLMLLGERHFGCVMQHSEEMYA